MYLHDLFNIYLIKTWEFCPYLHILVSEILTVKVLNRSENRKILNLNCGSVRVIITVYMNTTLAASSFVKVLYLSFYHGKSNWPKICTKDTQYLQQLDTPKNLSNVKYISHH